MVAWPYGYLVDLAFSYGGLNALALLVVMAAWLA